MEKFRETINIWRLIEPLSYQGNSKMKTEDIVKNFPDIKNDLELANVIDDLLFDVLDIIRPHMPNELHAGMGARLVIAGYLRNVLNARLTGVASYDLACDTARYRTIDAVRKSNQMRKAKANG